MLERTGGDDDSDGLGAMDFQDSGAFVCRGAGGHHIVDQQELLGAEVACAFEGATDISAAFLVRQVGLRRSCARPREHIEVYRNAKRRAQ